jgi:Mg2+ and Co2+ transporter CorA
MFQPSYYQLVLSYNAQTRVTHGLLLSKTTEHKIPNLIDSLKEEPWRCEEPLYLALLLAELSVNTSAERIQCAELRLNELEEMMGQHEYANMEKGRPLEIDFELATTRPNFQTKWLAVQSMRLGSVLLALDQIVLETREIAKRCGGNVGELDLASLASEFDSLRMMEEFVAYLTNTAKNLLLRAEYENRRIGAQIQVVRYFRQPILGMTLIRKVYQFMAHKNANVNIELAKHTSVLAEASKDDSAAMRTIALESSFLAKASKKDSSAMKTISIVGMVFLPGTFLAASS